MERTEALSGANPRHGPLAAVELKYDDQYARGYGVKTVSVWLNSIRRNGGVLEMPEVPQATQTAKGPTDDEKPRFRLGGDGCLM